MRETPSHIARALREYDPRLELRWDPRTSVWMFYCGGESLFAYRHEDNSFAMEPNVGEVMQIVRRTDSRNSRDFWTAQMKSARARRRELERKEYERIREQCSEHANDYAGFYRNGPTPMVSPLLNPAM